MANGIQITEGVGKFLSTLEKVWTWGTQHQQIVAVGDGGASTNLATVDANGNLLVYVSGLKNGIKQSQITVGTTAAQVTATPLTGRLTIILYNESANPIRIGGSNVTNTGATAGLLIPSGQSISLDISSGVAIYAISTVAASTLTILEIA